MLTQQQTKKEFINSIHKWLIRSLKENDCSEYTENFRIEGSSIICDIPENFFNHFEIPAGTRIEMKFVAKKI